MSAHTRQLMSDAINSFTKDELVALCVAGTTAEVRRAAANALYSVGRADQARESLDAFRATSASRDMVVRYGAELPPYPTSNETMDAP